MSSSKMHLGDLFSCRKEPGDPGLPVLSVTMTDGLVRRDSLDRKDDSELAPEQHLLIRKGDIAYNMMRMWQGASGMAHCDGMVSPAYVVLKPKDGIDPLFASYWFKSTRMIRLFQAYSYGITGDRLRLYYKDFARIPVTVPSKPEQIRIAILLSAWDRAIERTEALIAARRRLKKGLAQELLTGKRRLPGFEGEWAKYEFRQIASISNRRIDPKLLDTNKLCIELEHIAKENGQLLGTVDSSGQQSIKSVFDKGDILFGKLRPNLRKYYLCDFSGLCSTEIWVLRSRREVVESRFLYHIIQTERFISAACVTTGSKMPRADWSYISEVPFNLPPISEQKHIADILQTLEHEINLLSQKIITLRTQKKGLMQKLLTGQVPVKAYV